ncbi:MAG: hypothetical protein LC749_09205 [Actinobacteria bacterium]|nr:hypothetical protein [Actinomycetota bacterium]
MCELLVGLPEVTLLGIADEADGPLWVHVETRAEHPVCAGCDGPVAVKHRPRWSSLTCRRSDGQPAGVCASTDGDAASRVCGRLLAEEATGIAAARLVITDRAGRWVTEQVGRWGRTVNEVALELGCDWHTINDTVVTAGTALVDDDPDRIGTVTALGRDETLFMRRARSGASCARRRS